MLFLYEDKKISLDFHICINAPLMEHYIRKCNINVCNNISSKDLVDYTKFFQSQEAASNILKVDLSIFVKDLDM